MKKTFEAIVDRFSKKGNNLEEIRVFFLTHRDDNDYFAKADKLMFLAVEKKDRVAEAFMHVVKFWELCKVDLAAAKAENEAARNIFYSLNDYENVFGYVSYINNCLLAAMFEGNIDDAYTYAEKGLRLTKNSYDDFHIAFTNNYIYILNETGLYDRALKVAEANLLLKNIMMRSQQYLSEHLYINELILVGKYDDAERALNEIASRENNIRKYFDYGLFIAERLRLSVTKGDSAAADECFKKICSVYSLDKADVSFDNAEVYFDVAAYYYFIGDNEKAYEYYKICYGNKDKFLGKKTKILRPLVALSKKLAPEETEKYAEELNRLVEKCTGVVEKIISTNGDASSSSNIDLSEFEESVGRIRNLYNLKEYVIFTIKKLFGAQYASLSYRNNADGYFTLERYNSTKVFTLSEVHKLESFGDYPVPPVELPFKVDSECRAAYIVTVKGERLNAFMFIGYDEENMYTHGVNKVAIDRMAQILAARLDSLYDDNETLYRNNRDFLTRLNNRYAFYKFANDKKSSLINLYVAIFKIDGFEKISRNNLEEGNSVCVNFASVFAKYFPDKYAFKYDAHTFIGFLPCKSDELEKTLDELFNEVRLSVAVCGGRQIKYTVSAGAAFVLNMECFDNAFDSAWDRLSIARKTGDNYVLFIDKNMQLETTRYLINLREYLAIDNSPFYTAVEKDELISALKRVYDREREIMLDNNAIIQDTYTKYMKGEAEITYDGFKILKEFTRNLLTITKNFDTPLAYSIHELLYKFAGENNMLDESVEELYYLGLTAWQLGSFGITSPVTMELVDEYRGRFSELSDVGKVFLIRTFGNLTLLHTNKSINTMRGIVEKFMAFIDEVEDNYNLDYNFSASRLSVYLNGYTSINYLLKNENEMTPENIDFVYLCAERAMNLVDSVGATTSSRMNVEYVYHVACYYKGFISGEHLIEYLRIKSIPPENASYAEKYNAIMWFGIRYLSKLLDIDPSAKDTDVFRNRIMGIMDFIKTDGIKNIAPYVEQNILDFIKEFCLVLPVEDIKKVLLEITVERHASTVIHVYGVTEIYGIILDYMLEHNPEYFVGILGGFTLDDVKNRKEEIRAIGRDMALFHDIGKHSIIRIIGNSSRRLFDFEFNALKTHVTYGYKMIENVNFNEAIKDGILFHHKWYNNEGGYPAQSDETCNKPLVDILSVADSIDAATDKYGRSYAFAKSLKALLDEFNCFKNTRYSAAVIEALSMQEVFDNVNDFIERRRVDMIYDVYKKFERS